MRSILQSVTFRFCADMLGKQLEYRCGGQHSWGWRFEKHLLKSTGVTEVESWRFRESSGRNWKYRISKAPGEKVLNKAGHTRGTQRKNGTRIYWAPPGTRADTLHMWPHLTFTVYSSCDHCQSYPWCMQRAWEFWHPLPQIKGYVHPGGTKRVDEESQRSEFQAVKKGVREEEA